MKSETRGDMLDSGSAHRKKVIDLTGVDVELIEPGH